MTPTPATLRPDRADIDPRVEFHGDLLTHDGALDGVARLLLAIARRRAGPAGGPGPGDGDGPEGEDA